jgi:nucleotide-binding universal stress UspA family protein
VTALGEEPIGKARAVERQHHPVEPRPVHPVIVGYSGSAPARNAMAYAAGVAKWLERPLLVVYVITPGIYCAPLAGQVMGLTDNIRALERWLFAEFTEVANPTGLDVHVRAQLGHPAAELAAMAAELSADALVIGAPVHFWHRVAGSVPGSLARRARCPVIIIP